MSHAAWRNKATWRCQPTCQAQEGQTSKSTDFLNMSEHANHEDVQNTKGPITGHHIRTFHKAKLIGRASWGDVCESAGLSSLASVLTCQPRRVGCATSSRPFRACVCDRGSFQGLVPSRSANVFLFRWFRGDGPSCRMPGYSTRVRQCGASQDGPAIDRAARNFCVRANQMFKSKWEIP